MTSVMHIMYTLRSNHSISEIPKIRYLVPGCDYNLYGEPLRAIARPPFRGVAWRHLPRLNGKGEGVARVPERACFGNAAEGLTGGELLKAEVREATNAVEKVEALLK